MEVMQVERENGVVQSQGLWRLSTARAS